MRNLLLLLLMPLLPACQYPDNNTDNVFNDKKGDPGTWHRLEYGGFVLKAPGDWVRYSLRGIDSYVGGLTNDTDKLEFDIGPYGEEIGGNGDPSRSYAMATIDGFSAVIGIPKNGGEGKYELELELPKHDKFLLSGHVRDTRVALGIFQSLTLDIGHPLQTDSLTLDRFTHTYPVLVGKMIFYQNCSPCHTRYKIFTGPALSPEFLEPRDNHWMYRFLTHRSKMAHDSLWLATSREYNSIPCTEFPTLSGADVDQLMRWLRERQTTY